VTREQLQALVAQLTARADNEHDVGHMDGHAAVAAPAEFKVAFALHLGARRAPAANGIDGCTTCTRQ